MFTHAIVRRPASTLAQGISSVELGKPDYYLACEQHDAYIGALEKCGLQTTVLEALDEYPDSCFVEDVAVFLPSCVVLTHPGARSRQGEVAYIREAINKFTDKVEFIESPGTLEGGDVMEVEGHYYIGLSARTNESGAEQFQFILASYGLSGETVPLREFLHLKSGLSFLGNNTLAISGEFCGLSRFSQFNRLQVAVADAYSTNCVRVNDFVLVAAGFPVTRSLVEDAGFQVIEVSMSEFEKIDGGLSCLSLRF